MGISLLIAYADNTIDDVYLPVVAECLQSSFSKYWQPCIDGSKLKWVALTASPGLEVMKQLDNIDEIEAEYQVLLQYLLSQPILSENSQQISSIRKFLQILAEVKANPSQFTEVFIG